MKTALISLLLLVLCGGSALADNKDKGKVEEEDSRPTHEVLGIETHPYGGLTLTRPFDVEDVSVGFKVGVEADIQPMYLGVELHLRDILTDETGEVFPWDGEFEITLGAYW